MAKHNTIRALNRAGEDDDSWTLGFGLALAEVNRRIDEPTVIVEVARDAGFLDMSGFESAGLDEFDLDELARCLPKKGRAAKSRVRRRPLVDAANPNRACGCSRKCKAAAGTKRRKGKRS